MGNYKQTLKEKRIESDKRIVASAVKSFGELGYTYSSIRDIAKGAGVTSGLITQRYGTKDNLFQVAYINAMEGAFSEVDINASPRECLCQIIHDIENLCEKRPDAFKFCNMLHNATDYPRESLVPYQEQLKKSNAYEILKKAQSKGMLPAGKLDLLLASFGAMVFHNVGLCSRYKLEYTEPESILRFIRFNDSISKREEKWHSILETAIVNTFDLLIYANLAENTGEILEGSDFIPVSGDITDVRSEVESTIRRIIPEEEQLRFREYLDLDTLSERMRGRKSISMKINDVDGRMLVHTFLPLTWDENGNLMEVFAGVYWLQLD